MCGIVGLFAFNEIGRFSAIKVMAATESLTKRGPDFQKLWDDHWLHMGHTRLSIIDLDSRANQPMTDETSRYTIAYNGEVYNFQVLKKELENAGVSFFSESDTEVVLKSFIHWGKKCWDKFNGFFAVAIYDKEEKSLTLARDRAGIKPLWVSEDEDKFVFASEMKALLKLGIEKELDYTSLSQYLHLNYIPSPFSILKNVQSLQPGEVWTIKKREVQKYNFIQEAETPFENLHYEQQQKKLINLLEESVQKRMIADVPLGAFLSGGIDSSVICALASRHTEKLHTFSIGYRDEPFFDETKYAHSIAQKFNTEHTVFSLTNQDLYEELFSVLDYLDEPFADSSALAVYILSQKTKQKVKVALSGDGADELFSGYNKHWAEYRMRHQGWKENMLVALAPIWKRLPQSRQSSFGNKIRQFQKFVDGSKMNPKERYWQWAGFTQGSQVWNLLSEDSQQKWQESEFEERKNHILQNLDEDFNSYLQTDQELVLVGDMLRKVDSMSMANGLEVRVPFLDKNVVSFVNNLPVSSKINTKIRKRILQDAFRDILPTELYNRPKKGFEVPLLKWFQTDLKDLIVNDLLSESFIQEQDIFSYSEIEKLKTQLFSSNPGDVHARIWGLIVFQHWWKKYFI